MNSSNHGKHSPSLPQRRLLLKSLPGLAVLYFLPAQAPAAPSAAGRLVVIFLRGAYDGLSALIPWRDAEYSRLRPNIAIPVSGSEAAALPLDETFALHPALAPLLPFWREGLLAAIPCAGSPHPTRSHFEAQHHWETGDPSHSRRADGWLNKLAGLKPQLHAACVGETNPQILAGQASVLRIARGKAATQPGAIAHEPLHQALIALYEGDDALSRAFRAGMENRLRASAMLSEAEKFAADNGAPPARGLVADARRLVALANRDLALGIGFLSCGGWDTHANQGATQGTLAQNFAALAEALVELQRGFSGPNDVIAVISEFGRTVAENGSRGTDHGHGNVLWLLGKSVNGGRWHGRWDGLARPYLYEGRDLPVHHDFRAIFACVLKRTLDLSDQQIGKLFPGFVEDASLAGLMHA